MATTVTVITAKDQTVRDKHLEALPVDNGWAGLVVFLLADPHLLEGRQGRQDGSTDPDGVFSLWWSDDLDLHR